MEPLDPALQALIETGRQKGYLTFAQVNDCIPGEDVDPEWLDRLLRTLEEQGVELVDEVEAREWERARDEDNERAQEPAEEEAADEEEVPDGWAADVAAAPLFPPLPPAPPANLQPDPARAWPAGDRRAHRAFFEAIRAAPADDAPRLIYADWLDERGDPRGEFIRTQIELERLPEDDPRRPDLKEREQDLLAAHEEEWLGPFVGVLRDLARERVPHWRGQMGDWGFRRGFLEINVGMPEHVLDLGPTLFDAGLPVLVGIQNDAGCLVPQWVRWAEFIASPYLGKITCVHSFDMDGGGGVMADAVVSSPHLSCLSSLDLMEEDIAVWFIRTLAGQHRLADRPSLELRLNRNSLDDECLAVLAASPNLACLTVLTAGDGQSDSSRITDAGARALAASPHLGRLHTLDLSVTDIGADGLRALLSSPHLTGLRTLILSHNYRRLAREGFHSLIDLEGPPSLTTLDLGNSGLSDPDAEALAACRWLSRLKVLRLDNNSFTPAGVRTLADSANLRNLDALDLGTGLYGSGPGGNRVGSEGLRALVQSPYLQRLTRLELRVAHIDGAGVREWASRKSSLRLTRLDLGENDLGPDGAEALAGVPWLAALETLDLSGNRIDDRGAAALAASRHLGRLTTLRLSSNKIGNEGVIALAASPHLARLRTLDLGNNPLGRRAVRALAGSPHLAGLTRLTLHVRPDAGDAAAVLLARSPYLRNLRSLSLGPGVGPEGARALAASPNFSRLLRLNLDSDQIGPEGVQTLASSPYLTRLTELGLYGNAVGAEGVRALAFSPYLTRLTTLDLRGNDIPQEGVDALLDGPALGRLTRLEVGRLDLSHPGGDPRERLLRSPRLSRLNTFYMR